MPSQKNFLSSAYILRLIRRLFHGSQILFLFAKEGLFLINFISPEIYLGGNWIGTQAVGVACW